MDELRADLKAAKVDTGPDALGRKLDLHCLRHTLNTALANTGTYLATAQKIMRHSDVKLTAGAYLDKLMLPTADAIDRLPRWEEVEAERQLKTGTMDTPVDTQASQNASRRDTSCHKPADASKSQVETEAAVSHPASHNVTRGENWGTRIRT